MKRLILTSTFLLLLIVSCDSPVSNSGDASQKSLIKAGHMRQMAVLTHTPAVKMDSTRRELALQFSARHGQGWKVSWSRRKSIATPTAVFGGATKPVHGSPEKSARAFLAQNRNLFNMHKGLGDLKLAEVQTSSNGVRHVRFQQMYHHIPVYEAGYSVHIRPDGRIDMANGHYYQNIKASTSPGLSSSAAKQRALSDLGGRVNLEQKIKEPELMIFHDPKKQNFALAWKIVIAAGQPVSGDWQYFIDANSGQVLRKLNMAAAITGEGDIIDKNTNLTPTPTSKSLYRLYDSGNLEGTYANIHNDIANRAHSSTYSFHYIESNTHFDEVNVYEHLDRFRSGYLANLGFNGDIGSDQDMEAWVHDIHRNPHNAKYYSAEDELRFGDDLDFAKQEKIIYHEFMHAVVESVNGSSDKFDETFGEEGGIAEGLADYFAGSKTNRSKILTVIHQEDSRIKVRDMADPQYEDFSNIPINYNTGEIYTDPHRSGEFFSAILWDIRNGQIYGGSGSEGNITHDMADQLVYRAISRVGGRPNFTIYRDAMITSDNNLNGGSHADFIQDAFAARGVGNFSPLDVSISGPSQLDAGQSATWTANASNGSGSYSYTWYRKAKSFDGSTFYYQVATGNSYTGSASVSTDFSLRVDVDDSNGKSGSSLKFVIVGQYDTPPPCNDGPPYHICIQQ